MSRSVSSSLATPKVPSSPISPTSPLARAVSGPVPRSGSTSPTPDSPLTPRPKTRARDLLRRHYGLGVGPPPPSGRSNDPMDVDSPAFDARAYYEQLITTSTLSTLLKRENELASEIRQLDSDRQSLVYNHHHELIAATDTIRAMKDRAEELDADLEKLKMAFSEISRLSAAVAIEHQDANSNA